MLAHAPFIRILLYLVIGILGYIEFPNIPIVFCGCLLVIGILGLVFFYKHTIVSSIFVFTSLALLGYFSAFHASNTFDKNVQALDNIDQKGVLIQIGTIPEKNNNYYKVEADVLASIEENNNELTNTSSRVLLYFNTKLADTLYPGLQLLIFKRAIRPQEPVDSYQFNYKQYLAYKGIPWIIYLNRPIEYTIIGAGELPLWKVYTTRIVYWADYQLKRYVKSEEGYGLVRAMILGRRDFISEEINQAYRSSGAVHILSVSGLHVGIFFIVLSFVLSPFKKNKYGRYLYAFVIIFCISVYALVTGLPPSVQRAALMAIIWVTAELFDRKSNGTNTLSFTAFLLLLFNPFVLYDIGFQLSFLAMLGIFLFSELIQDNWKIDSKIGKHFWSMACMSIAAQLMTLPLSIYYFHQFPSYFLLTNLLIIDIANLMLPATFLLLITSYFLPNFMNEVLGDIVNYLALFTNQIAELSQMLPMNLWEGLFIDSIQVMLLFILIILLRLLFMKQSYIILKSVCIVCLVLCSYSCITTYKTFIKTDIRLVGRSNELSVGYKVGSKVYLFSSSESVRTDSYFKWNWKDYVTRMQVDTTWVAL